MEDEVVEVVDLIPQPSTSTTTTTPVVKRGRGRPKRSQQDSENVGPSKKKGQGSTEPKRKTQQQQPNSTWTLEEKQIFARGLSSLRKPDGTINWSILTKSIGTKSMKEVKEFARSFNALHNGSTYEEFSTKAAVDVWRQLAGKLTMPGDDIDSVCIPQVLTVAALEPVKQNKTYGSKQPNYGNIYNYLSAVTRDADLPPELPVEDAIVMLDLLEDLIKWLSSSDTLVQREFMHQRYAELRQYLNISDDETTAHDGQFNTSTNPFSIPFDILEFKGEPFGGNPP